MPIQSREPKLPMLDTQDHELAAIADAWLDRFNRALGADEPLDDLFLPESHWRDLIALTGEIRTTSEAVPRALARAWRASGATAVVRHPTRLPPALHERAGVECIEAVFLFETPQGHGEGLVRWKASDPARAWTIMTSLDRLHDQGGRPEPAYARDVRAPNWADQREAARTYANRDPEVLVVGGGHAGLCLAARLGAMGVDTLVVDREARIGDNWRRRYHNLKLHNQIRVNEMPYLPYPSTWPRYIPKDMIANWLEFYTEALEINFWTETEFEGAERDDAAGVWRARLARDGEVRVMRVPHIVMAASTSAVPRYPDIPSLSNFEGPAIHAAHFEIGAEWAGRPVLVLGTGTSAHDIAQHLHAHGAQVTMVQRSPTMVVNVEPSAQLYDGLYLGDFDSIEDQDLINTSLPFALIAESHRRLTKKVAEIDRETREGLAAIGFRLSDGDNGTGWPLLYRTRGGGYYFNIGCSELLIAGEIGLIQFDAIEAFESDGVRMADGRKLAADLVVMATGYETQGAMIGALFGEEVRERAGQVWGFNEKTEMANMWTPTGQPGLWFTAGAFSQCRIYSKFLALLIAIDLRQRLRG